MTTGLTYATYQTQVAELAIVSPSDVNFQTILPAMIDYAELRIIRDLDLLSTVSSTTATLAIGTRQVTFSNLVTVQQINVITPSSQTVPDSGTRNPLTATTKEVLDILWPSTSGAGVPTRFAPFNQSTPLQNTFLVGPFPDAAYTVEVIGTVRPTSLGAPASISSGYTSGTSLVVTTVSSGSLSAGQTVVIPGIPLSTTVVSGPGGGTGTYVLSQSSTLGSVMAPVTVQTTSTTSTFISLNLPDLLVMASMVYISAYQRNFSGMSSNDPNMPISYEQQYKTLLESAGVEEARKKFQASAWSSMSPAPVATPTRG